MTIRAYFLGLMVLLSLPSYADQAYDQVPLDTLLNKLSAATTLKDSIDVYFQLSSHYVNYDLKKAEYYADEILKQSLKIDYKKGEADGYYAFGRLFHNSHYDISFNFVQKALVIYNQIDDKFQIAKSLNLLSIIKGNLGEIESALEYSNKVLEISLEIGDSTLYAMVLNNIGTYYSDVGNDTLANSYYFKAAKVNSETGHKRFLSINYGNICITSLDDHDGATARKYFTLSKQLKDEINDKEGYGWLYETYASIMQEEKKNDSALYYYNLSNSFCEKFKNRGIQEGAMKGLQKLHFEMGHIDSAYFWLVKLNVLRDSIYDKEKTKSIYLHEINLKHKQEQAYSKLKHRTQLFKMALVISVLGIIILITSMIIYVMNQRRKTIVFEREKEREDKLKLEQELSQKNQELATFVMNMVNNKQMLSNVVDKLNSNLESFAVKNQLIIRKIISELDSGQNKDIWKEFEYRFNQVHPNFQDKLLADYVDLTPNELKLCAFLKMNMTSKEISQITYQSIQSIEKARSRLRKKVKLTNTDVSFVYFLSKY